MNLKIVMLSEGHKKEHMLCYSINTKVLKVQTNLQWQKADPGAAQGEDVKGLDGGITKGHGENFGSNSQVLCLDYNDVSMGLYVCQNLSYCTL